MTEIINFFKFNTSYIHDTVFGLYKLWDYAKRKYLNFVDDIVSQTLRVNFKIDMKSPYIIFPEYGSMQKYIFFLYLIIYENSIQNKTVHHHTLVHVNDIFN